MTTTKEKIEALEWGIKALEAKIGVLEFEVKPGNENILSVLMTRICTEKIVILTEMKAELEAGQ